MNSFGCLYVFNTVRVLT